MDGTLSRPGCLLEIQPQPTLAPGVALASHLKLCDQVVLRIGTETRASRNLDTAIGHRHGLGEWCGGELGKKAFGTKVAPACSTSAATFAIAVMPTLTMLG